MGRVGQVGQVRQVGRVGQVGVRAARAEMWDRWNEWDRWENYSVIVRLSFAHRSLIVYSSYIVLFVFLIFTSSKFFILLSDFDCISIC